MGIFSDFKTLGSKIINKIRNRPTEFLKHIDPSKLAHKVGGKDGIARPVTTMQPTKISSASLGLVVK